MDVVTVASSYYIHGLWGDEIDFCCFKKLCHSTMDLTRVIKRQFFFTFILAVFEPQSIGSWGTVLPLLKTNSRHVRILLPVSISAHVIVSSMWFCDNISQRLESQISFKSDHPVCSYDVILWLFRWQRALRIYFRFVDVLHLRRFKTISILNFGNMFQSLSQIPSLLPFWKHTAAILKFYFRLRFWAYPCHRCVILHRLRT